MVWSLLFCGGRRPLRAFFLRVMACWFPFYICLLLSFLHTLCYALPWVFFHCVFAFASFSCFFLFCFCQATLYGGMYARSSHTEPSHQTGLLLLSEGESVGQRCTEQRSSLRHYCRGLGYEWLSSASVAVVCSRYRYLFSRLAIPFWHRFISCLSFGNNSNFALLCFVK